MILTLLRSKASIAVMAAVFCLVFFCLSKLKGSAHAASAPQAAEMALAKHRKSPRAAQVALLRRAEESARGRADLERKEHESAKRAGESYDESGNVYRRRPVPEPIALVSSAAPSGGESAVSDAGAPFDVPTLRIHGRRSSDAGEALTTHVIDTLRSNLPHASGGSDFAPSAERHERAKPERFVPFGRLIKAELVITLESTQDEMPLVGLVAEPVYNNGRLVIPAGTELHSMARPDRIRDRIISTTKWHLVFPREGNRPNGRQLTFDGVALDREDRDGNGLTWGLTDGSYGLRGRTIHPGHTEETLLLFAAEALKAASGTTMDRQQTILGPQVDVNARNAALAGGQAVLSRFAQGIEREIERNGVYIQVPAGKEFYVYPRQVIDPDRADIPDNVAKVE